MQRAGRASIWKVEFGLEKYPSGRRGSPAKGVGCDKRREGFKSLLLRQKTRRRSSASCFLSAYVESYRSGHNGAVLKTVRRQRHRGSNPFTLRHKSIVILIDYGGLFSMPENRLKSGCSAISAHEQPRRGVFLWRGSCVLCPDRDRWNQRKDRAVRMIVPVGDSFTVTQRDPAQSTTRASRATLHFPAVCRGLRQGDA